MSTNLGTNPIRTHQYFFPMLFISLLGTFFHFFFYPFKLIRKELHTFSKAVL